MIIAGSLQTKISKFIIKCDQESSLNTENIEKKWRNGSKNHKNFSDVHTDFKSDFKEDFFLFSFILMLSKDTTERSLLFFYFWPWIS